MDVPYGISTCLNVRMSQAEIFAAIARAGFKHVEILTDRGCHEDWVSDPAGTRREIEKHGLEAISAHSPEAGWKNNAPDESARRASVEAVAACFEPARIVGARVVIVHPTSGDFDYTAETFDAHRARAIRSLTELARRAAEAGLRLAVENLPARGKPRPGTTAGEALEMIRGLGDHVGLCLDGGHSNCNGLNPADEAHVAGPKLFAVHIQDNDGKGKDNHLMPGRGTTDWAGFMRSLDRIGFSGGRVFEVPQVAEGAARTLAILTNLVRRWRAGRRPD
ncbi:MAG: sugar phosphate isomerase/epimerase family protein [Verrucomicrobiota bacterium]|nr:sugar phosphate isomerase/epimerase family protein [Verrucomicrobiota bacterium]